ncbi:MAG: OmpP1/FadL family transporter, partial [Candidatus Eisenbacteria bacterium]
MRLRSMAAIVSIAVALPALARASGYQIYEQGAAVLGMAGAGTASVHDPSALFFNPAAITRLPGQQLMIGGHMVSPVVSFAGTPAYPGYGVTEEMTRQSFYIPNFYYTYNTGRKLAFGAALDAPYGLGIEWKDPETFTGRYIVTKGDLRTLNASATVAYALTPHWSFAAGFDALWANVSLHNIQTAVLPGGSGGTANVANVELSTDYTPGYTWNAGLDASPNDQWRFGLHYRHFAVVSVDKGKATFQQIPYSSGNPSYDNPFNAAVAAGLPPDQTVKTTLRMPAILSAGVAYSPKPDWTLEGDFNVIRWSIFTDIPLEFQSTPSANRTIVENYKDVVQFRVGAENRLKSFTYRFGYYFDQGAAPPSSVTPLLPESDRHAGAFGIGLPIAKNWWLDAYELAIFPVRAKTEGQERDGFDGEY